MRSTLFLCGAGNAEGVRLALRINKKQKNWEKIYILDDDGNKKGKRILGVEILGPFDILDDADPKTNEVVNLVARTTFKRKAAFEKISNFGIPFVSLIDPDVDTWGVDYKGDVIIYPNVTFSASAVLDHGSVAFTGAVIGHGCTVGKFCIIAPGAVLNARIIIEEGVYIGTEFLDPSGFKNWCMGYYRTKFWYRSERTCWSHCYGSSGRTHYYSQS